MYGEHVRAKAQLRLEEENGEGGEFVLPPGV
jgi:hypothetical protein